MYSPFDTSLNAFSYNLFIPGTFVEETCKTNFCRKQECLSYLLVFLLNEIERDGRGKCLLTTGECDVLFLGLCSIY